MFAGLGKTSARADASLTESSWILSRALGRQVDALAKEEENKKRPASFGCRPEFKGGTKLGSSQPATTEECHPADGTQHAHGRQRAGLGNLTQVVGVGQLNSTLPLCIDGAKETP